MLRPSDLASRNITIVKEIEESALERRSPLDCVVDHITGFCGSLSFVWVHAGWFAIWIAFNCLPYPPKHLQFDQYPFQFLSLAVSLEAIFLSTFILISQNRQNRLSERRATLDLQINALSEAENARSMRLLEALCEKMGVEVSPSEEEEPAVKELNALLDSQDSKCKD